MKIVGQDDINRFKRKYPHSRRSLDSWVSIMRGTEFRHFEDLKRTFGSADCVAPFTVFNVSGNKFRLIARVEYSFKAVVVHDIMPHEKYDRWNKK